MKRLFYLVNFETRSIIAKVLILSGCMAAAEMIYFLIVIFNEKNQFLRFEDLMNAAGYPPMFYISLGILLGLVVFTFYRNYFGSKSIYTLMALPSKRSFVFLGKYISALVSVLIFTGVQIISIFLTYGLYLFSFPDIPRVNNGLFLAFMRSGFLRIIFPFDLLSFTVSLVSLISLVAMALFGVICERGRNFAGLIIIPLILFGAVAFTFPLYRYEIWHTIKGLGVIIACTAFMIRYSIKAVEKTKIL